MLYKLLSRNTNTPDLFDLFNVSNDFMTFNKKFDMIFEETTFPPYDIINISDNEIAIDIALAGYLEDDIKIINEKDLLVISVDKEQKEEDKNKYLKSGIAKRNFKLKFTLHELFKISFATFENGILRIFLEKEIPKEPEQKVIPISKPLDPQQTINKYKLKDRNCYGVLNHDGTSSFDNI